MQTDFSALFLLAYDFDIEYVNTKDFGQADALSRLIARTSDKENERVIASIDAEADMNGMLNDAVSFLPITFQDLVAATDKDAALKRVIGFIRNGWPDQKRISEEDEQIREFHRRKDELTVSDGCLMYAGRVIIPATHQQKVLKLLYKGHPGMKRMKQLARQFVYWPKIDAQIEDFVRNCDPCQQTERAPVKTSLQSWPKATAPWQRIHMDYAGPFYGKDFLIIVDAFSKYPEVFEMRSKSTAATIDKLRYLFTRHGIPEVLMTDNGT